MVLPALAISRYPRRSLQYVFGLGPPGERVERDGVAVAWRTRGLVRVARLGDVGYPYSRRVEDHLRLVRRDLQLHHGGRISARHAPLRAAMAGRRAAHRQGDPALSHDHLAGDPHRAGSAAAQTRL